MIDNNLLFSLILAIINTIAFYFLKNSDENIDKEKRNTELLFLFGVTFISSFLTKILLNSDILKKGGYKEKTLTHSTRAPF